MKELITQVTRDFESRWGGLPTAYSQSPGRINILGEHTDYTGGLSLPAAIDCWTVAAWRTRADDRIFIHSRNVGELWRTSWKTLESDIRESWQKYVGGALALFHAKSGRALPGFELAIVGNIPLGKGLSSSAAIELAVLNGANFLFAQNLGGEQMALLAQQVEHRFLKVKSGLLDQFACQFCKSDAALLIDFSTLKTQPAPLASAFSGFTWVLVDSMVKRELSGSKYSERVEEYLIIQKTAERAGVPRLQDLSSADAARMFASAPTGIQKRARHITSENERTRQAAKCLSTGDVADLGRLLTATHNSLSVDYEVSHPNLDFMVDAAVKMPGVKGGRMMGGGFGGCGLFLVEKSHVADFSRQIAASYFEFSGLKTEPRAVNFADGASAWAANGR